MPLIHRRELHSSSLIGIWEVTETEKELLIAYPCNESELAKLNSYTHAFRRTQFLASRLLLHTLLPGAKIVYDENGKPFPDTGKNHISISHSGKLIAIMTEDDHCGIDIEIIHPKIERIAPKFLSPAELISCSGEETVNKMHVYWCVKEAIYKVYGRKNVSLKSDIFVDHVSNPLTGKVKATLKQEGSSFSRFVSYEQFGECMLAWTGKNAHEKSL